MMGVVYEAEDTLLGRAVALKTIELAFDVDEEAYGHFEERFFTEARVAAKLSHPGIVVCHDVGKDETSGKLFIVFEYLKGLTLAERIVADTIAWEDALAIAVKVGRAIHHAHANGVIHRDIKPANVMLLDSGHAGLEASAGAAIKIMDFGVARLESLPARLTRTGQSFGSPLYMSPEQVLGHAATARSDIFSLGSVLSTLLLGRGWFEAKSIPEVLSRVVHDDAPVVSKLRPYLPATLDDVVARALAKLPEHRYASAAELADDLEDILSGLAPRHVSGLPAPPAPGRGAGERDALLADLARGAAGAAVAVDPAEALASLVDDVPSAETPPLDKADRTHPVALARDLPPMGERRTGVEAIPPQAVGELTLPSWTTPGSQPALPPPLPSPPDAASQPSPAPSAAPARRSHRIAKLAAGAAIGGALAGGAFLLWRMPAAARVPEVAPSPASSPGPTQPSPVAPAGVPVLATPSEAPAESPAPAREKRPTPPTSGARAPSVTPPGTATSDPASDPPAASAQAAPERTRMRLVVEHPFENGRLIVWIDGVLVYETKLQAESSRRIVAIKVLEGRIEKRFDVTPGRHEVRVEVTWDDQHSVGSRVVDVAPAATGLLEVRVSRLTKDLTLEWSRLAD